MKIDKTIQLNSLYVIDGIQVSNFYCSIVLDPFDYNMSSNISDSKVYRQNRDEIDQSYREFQDEAYKIIDKLEANHDFI